MKTFNRKMKYALLSILSNSTLIIMKTITGLITGSVSIISEAIHSAMDLVASIIAFFSVRYAAKPADEDHPYGHGKIENISGFLEALLIFVAAIIIIKEAIAKIINPTAINITTIAILVMVVSAVINAIVSSLLYKVAREEDSVALEADALHLKTDVYTSLGVGLGLLIIKFTNWYIVDSIVAILVALIILKEAWHLSVKAFQPLLDASLGEEDEAQIMQVIERYQDRYVNVHNLRTRKAGHIKHIDFHLCVDGNQPVSVAHQLCDEIEQELAEEIKNTCVNIHIEPCDCREGE